MNYREKTKRIIASSTLIFVFGGLTWFAGGTRNCFVSDRSGSVTYFLFVFTMCLLCLASFKPLYDSLRIKRLDEIVESSSYIQRQHTAWARQSQAYKATANDSQTTFL